MTQARDVRLPEPRLTSGSSVAEALRARATVREISPRRLELQLLSDVLFAASGVNRVFGAFGGRGLTAASASNSHEIDVYVALEDGSYRFDPASHELCPVTGGDLRGQAFGPHQPSICPNAPVQLVYVVNLDKLEHTTGFDEPGLHDAEIQKSYYFVDTGLMAGNVYLYAASQGLACWFHNCDRAALAASLKLSSRQRVLFAQTVGYPANEWGC